MIEQVTSTGLPAEGSQIPTAKGDDQKSQFLQLLIAQIKGQDPMDPMDGSQFVAQLAQFTSVEELIAIRELMGDVQGTLEQQNALMTANDDGVAGDEIFGADES